jgi:NNP family nitrate/nitrite transporter-like MFS transporter
MTVPTARRRPFRRAGETDARAAGRQLPGRGRWIHHWEPDDPDFWAASGRRVARRNLIWSVLAEHIGFSVWTLLSVVQLSLGQRYGFTANQLLWLVGVASIVGAAVRLPYSFAPTRFGGRNWTVVSALLLVVPAGLLTWALGTAHPPFWAFLVIAALLGLGGGNFASSMANISSFYPVGRQGLPLGLNAAGGNIGVATGQLLVPLAVIPLLGLAGAGLVWIPVALVAAAGAYLFMDNLAAAESAFDRRDIARVLRGRHVWVMSVLYIGTFGSFIGYSFTFPLLIQSQFPGINVVHYAFLGALVGSLSRPVGGWLADRLGGARVTVGGFLAMGLGIGAVAMAIGSGSFPIFLAAFLLVFVTAGIGNGSTYKMIPAICTAQALRATAGPASAEREKVGRTTVGPPTVGRAVAIGRRDTAAVIGITSAIGAAGGFFISQGFRVSLLETGSIAPALVTFAVFYAGCLALTWWCYLRRQAAITQVPVSPGLVPAQI